MRRACLALLLTALRVAPGHAATVLETIRQTGVLAAGTREDAVPFAFRRSDGELVGFSVDLLDEIRKRTEALLGRKVELHRQPTTPQTRIQLVRDGSLAIECGITTVTWGREKDVDFSVPFYANGTRVLALRRTAHSLADLAQHRIGVLANSTTLDIIKTELPEAVTVEVPDMREGLGMLLAGSLDGLANVGVVLRAQIEHLQGKSRFVLLPSAGSLSWESLACVLPKDDSAWRDLVDHTISDLLDGVQHYHGGWVDLYERWFGPQGEVYYPLDQETAERLAALRVWLD